MFLLFTPLCKKLPSSSSSTVLAWLLWLAHHVHHHRHLLCRLLHLWLALHLNLRQLVLFHLGVRRLRLRRRLRVHLHRVTRLLIACHSVGGLIKSHSFGLHSASLMNVLHRGCLMVHGLRLVSSWLIRTRCHHLLLHRYLMVPLDHRLLLLWLLLLLILLHHYWVVSLLLLITTVHRRL